MTIIYAASPGSASHTLNKKLEILLNTKSINLKSGDGIGNLILNMNFKNLILHKLKINILKKKLVYGHIFPTKYNLQILNNYFNIKHFIISYRNIYDQLNYFYKWQKYNNRGPLNFPEDVYFQNDFNIDLNLLLVLNFYKHWFYLIQKKKINNVTLISFKEITSNNEIFKQKMLNIFPKANLNQFINEDIKENIYQKEYFKLNQKHVDMINNFISSHKQIDFSLITKKIY